MIFIHPSILQHSPRSGPEINSNPVCRKAYSTASCSNDEETKSDTLNKDELKFDSTRNTSESQRFFVERAPIHFHETDEAATIALDVAGFSSQDIQVRMEDFVVSIDAKRLNKLGDTYVIRRRFRLDKTTVIEDMVRANLTDHILEVVVPKKAKVGPRSIPISTAAATMTSSNVEGKEESEETVLSETEHQNSNDEEETASSVSSVVDVNETEEEQENEQTQPGAVEEESWEDVKH
jgi:HSP20 family molecular chaperone IbpA